MSIVDEFKVVNRRRKSNRLPRGVHRLIAAETEEQRRQQQTEDSEIDLQRVKRVISKAVEIIENSDYGNILFHGIDEALRLIDSPVLPDIICYGLGNFSQLRASKFQLAAILSIKSRYSSENVQVYDPLFYKSEKTILEDLNIRLIETNEEARRTIDDKTCLVYMPHCPYQLTNNFINANWSLKKLSNCLVLTNSFAELLDSVYSRKHEETTNYIARIFPYTTEITLINSFEYEEIFNGSSLHIFQRENLNKVPANYWQKREQPIYREENCDFVRNLT